MSYLSTVQTDAPVHYWRMADPGGGLLHDIGSSPLHLIYGASAQQPYSGIAADGGAFFAQGAGPTKRAGLTQALPLSVEMWFWLCDNDFSAVAQLMFWDGNVNPSIAIYVDNVAVLHAVCNGTSGTYAGPVTAQVWHHLVLTMTSTGALVYLDATLRITLVGAQATITRPIEWGGQPGGSGNENLFVTECALYSAVLSPTQITAHFAARELTGSPVFQLGGNPLNPTYGVTGGVGEAALALIYAAVHKIFPTT